jgi:NAD+ diphosphatase
VTLENLALSRSTLDRAGERRSEPDLLARLLADPGTAVLPLVGGRAPALDGDAGTRLVLLGGAEVGDITGAEPMFLGVDGDGRAHVALAWPAPADRSAALPDAVTALPLPGGARWAGLREVGWLLGDADAGILTASVALSAWHVAHPHCARCGARTDVVEAGWARRCPACGAEHYPRTDPAVIMVVVDAEDRVLLGHQATWPEGRYSTLAGFVEPGESLEAAVRREVGEEAGIVVGEVTYRGSQPWPFPSSLMLGFTARAVTTDVRVDGVELSDARWWSRRELAADIASGALLVPPGVSIARRLIEDWFGGPLEGAAEAWR